MKRFKKFLKILLSLFLLLLITLYVLFYWFTAPKADSNVLKAYEKVGVQIDLSYQDYKGFKYRKIEVKKDTALPTIVFVHGTIGSVLDFKKYFADSTLSSKANLIAYDRIGYNYNDENPVQESIEFERKLLEDLVSDIPPKKLILVGYSYGGPIVLAVEKKTKKTILLAPAVYSKVEPMPFMLNMYKWKITRWLVPPIWKQASKEKMSHPKDLQNFELEWNNSPNEILTIHGNKDWIVPYTNSEYLLKIFPKDQIQMITINNAGHDLIWSNFKKIKSLLLKQV